MYDDMKIDFQKQNIIAYKNELKEILLSLIDDVEREIVLLKEIEDHDIVSNAIHKLQNAVIAAKKTTK